MIQGLISSIFQSWVTSKFDMKGSVRKRKRVGKKFVDISPYTANFHRGRDNTMPIDSLEPFFEVFDCPTREEYEAMRQSDRKLHAELLAKRWEEKHGDGCEFATSRPPPRVLHRAEIARFDDQEGEVATAQTVEDIEAGREEKTGDGEYVFATRRPPPRAPPVFSETVRDVFMPDAEAADIAGEKLASTKYLQAIVRRHVTRGRFLTLCEIQNQRRVQGQAADVLAQSVRVPPTSRKRNRCNGSCIPLYDPQPKKYRRNHKF